MYTLCPVKSLLQRFAAMLPALCSYHVKEFSFLGFEVCRWRVGGKKTSITYYTHVFNLCQREESEHPNYAGKIRNLKIWLSSVLALTCSEPQSALAPNIKNKEVDAFAKVVLQIARQPTSETQVEKTLKGFCSGNIARQTRPCWAKVGSWQTRLSPTFHEPSANLSQISCL